MDLLHHLANDNFYMLIVDLNTLIAVNLLYLADNIILCGAYTVYPEDIMRVDRTLRDTLASLYLLSVLDKKLGTERNRV